MNHSHELAQWQRLPPRRHLWLVECGRGLAAFYVVLHHIVITLVPEREHLPRYIKLVLEMHFAPHAVMFFFLLSGLSIHYAHLDRPAWGHAAAREYLYMRFRRIYPIFAMAVALGLLVLAALRFNNRQAMPEWPGLRDIVATPVFLTDLPIAGHWFAVLPTNGPLWSLSYEVVYYALYPLFWLLCMRIGVLRAVAAAAALSLCAFAWNTALGPNHLCNVLSLYVLWALGALLGERVRRGLRFHWRYAVFVMFCYVFCQVLWPLEVLFTWRIPGSYSLLCGVGIFTAMTGAYASFAPDCMTPRERLLAIPLILALALVLLWLPQKISVGSDSTFYYLRVCLTASIALVFTVRGSDTYLATVRLLLKPWHRIGAYSYALYVLHFPLLTLAALLAVALELPLWWGLAMVPVAFFIARIVELRLQPRAAAWLDNSALAPARAR